MWILKIPPSASGIQAVYPTQTLYHGLLLFQAILLDQILIKITPGPLTHPPSPWELHTLLTPRQHQSSWLFILSWNLRKHTLREPRVPLKAPLTHLEMRKTIPLSLADGIGTGNGKLKDDYNGKIFLLPNYLISLPNLRSYSLIDGHWKNCFLKLLARCVQVHGNSI